MDDIWVGACRAAGWVQVTRGAYRRDIAVRGDQPEEEGVRRARLRAERISELRAWQEVLPPEASFTHLTAAWLHGWWTPAMEGIPVFAVTSRGPRVRRSGIRVSRLDEAPAYDVIDGLRVADPGEVVLGCARDLGLLDLVPLLDSAARWGVDLDALRTTAGSGRHGGAALRRALTLADPRAESPWETVLRLQHQTFEVEVVPQLVVEDARGFVARGDLWIAGTRTLQEYDGAVHRTRAQQREDLRRQRRLNEAGWTRNGYTSVDVVARPHLVLRDADRVLGRPYERTRIDAWRALLRGSSLTAPGQVRLLKRWRVSSGQ